MIKMVIVDKWINGCWETDQNLLSESFFLMIMMKHASWWSLFSIKRLLPGTINFMQIHLHALILTDLWFSINNEGKN